MNGIELDIDVAQLSRADAAHMLAQVKALEGRLLARLLADQPGNGAPATRGHEGDRLLSVGEAAALLSVSKSWLYHRAHKLGIARKLSDGTLRISYAACQKLIRSRPHAVND